MAFLIPLVSSRGGVIVPGVKRYKWLLFSGHTLQGPGLYQRHNGPQFPGRFSGGSPYPRLAPVAHLSTGAAAFSGRRAVVTVTRKDPDSWLAFNRRTTSYRRLNSRRW